MEIKYALKEMLSERIRLTLTLLAIAWGTLAISIMLSVGQGLLVTLTGFMQQMGSNLVVAMPGSSSLEVNGQLSGTEVAFSDNDLAALSKLPNITEISPEYSASGVASYQNIYTPISLSGVTGNYLLLHKVSMDKGRFINANDVAMGRSVIVLGYDIAHTLFGQHDPLGQSIQLGPYNFMVIGTTAYNKSQVTYYEAADNDLAWIPASTFKTILPSLSIAYILMNSSSNNAQALQNEVRITIARTHQLSFEDKNIVEFMDNQDAIKSTEGFFRGLQWFLGALGSITLLIASLGIANIMYLAVQRAIPSIGIRMALGARVSEIVRHYLIEALLVSLLGGLIGLVFCSVIIFIANLILPNISIFGLSGLHLSLSLPLVAIIIFILTLVGLAAGIFPAMRAARINPVEALRHE